MKNIIQITLVFALAYMSGEILVRRWWFDQIPTQITPGLVYIIIAINIGVLVFTIIGRHNFSKNNRN